VPSYVCTAVLNAVLATGAEPVLADVDDTHNLSPHDASTRLSPNTKAVIATHTYGTPADVEELAKLPVPLVEDCAQGLGSRLGGKPVGSFGCASVFSFYATKPIAGGGGGMVATDDSDIVDVVRDLREYDERDEFRVRHNYKLSDVHAALAASQFRKLEGFIRRRRDVARRYDEALARAGAERRIVPRRGNPNMFRYVVDFGAEALRALDMFERFGVRARRPIYKPLHQYLRREALPNTDRAWRGSVSIPLYPGLTEAEENRIIEALEKTASSPRGV